VKILPATLAIVLAMPMGAQALEPVGTFGEWRASCEKIGAAARCVIGASEEDWAGDKVALFYHPEQRNLTVTVQGREFRASARVDRGAPVAGDCLPPLCDFGRNGFGAALEQGTVLFLTVSGGGKADFTFAKNLLDLRKAVAAAKEWAGKRQ
jgi:hypothetical protein